MSVQRSVSLPSGAPEYIRRNLTAMRQIPEPPETWYFSDVDIELEHLQKLVACDLVDKVGRDNDRNVNEYRLRRHVVDFLDRVDNLEYGLPCCGATGFTNRGHGYECNACGRIHDADTVRESLWGGDQ